MKEISGDARRRRHDRNRQYLPGSGRGGRRLARDCHIFAAAVREVMEMGPLGDAVAAPLSMPQFLSLKLLARTGAKSMGEIARLLGVTPPAATKIIDKLERLGLVSRSPAPGDRRATMVSARPEGRRVVERYEVSKENHVRRVMSSFTPVELAHLSEWLEALSLSLLSGSEKVESSCLRCSAYIEEGCLVGRSLGGCPIAVRRDARCAAERAPAEASGA